VHIVQALLVQQLQLHNAATSFATPGLILPRLPLLLSKLLLLVHIVQVLLVQQLTRIRTTCKKKVKIFFTCAYRAGAAGAAAPAHLHIQSSMRTHT
jgi:hypothetical protein